MGVIEKEEFSFTKAMKLKLGGCRSGPDRGRLSVCLRRKAEGRARGMRSAEPRGFHAPEPDAGGGELRTGQATLLLGCLLFALFTVGRLRRHP